MTDGQLFDTTPKQRRPRARPGQYLPVVAPPTCPRETCRAPLTIMRPHVQPALFFHGGYGAAERTTSHVCVRCGWTGTLAVETINPRGLPQ